MTHIYHTRPELQRLLKVSTVPALGVRGMVVWTVGTTEQEAHVNPEHRQPDLETKSSERDTELLLAFLPSASCVSAPLDTAF